MNVTCPHCQRQLSVLEKIAGQPVTCGFCAVGFQVPVEAPQKVAHPQEHFLGIDFGTCNSSMAWFNPKTGQAETLLNAEGEDKTPSVVYYGDKEILVGKYAEDKLERPEDRKRIITAAKRELAKSRKWMIGTRCIGPVDVAAEILKKLKRDAENTHFHGTVGRAVITFPAVFDELGRSKIREAALQAGFQTVELLEEPVAAAMAYTEAGVNVGRCVLVYDLGGGTFDLAMLAREEGETSFRLVLEPRGDRVGGEDFDHAIYMRFDDKAIKKVGQPICPDGIDLHLLRQCRRFKENLSVSEQPHPFSWWWPGKGRLQMSLTRETFEGLIREHVDRTMRLTLLLRDDASGAGHIVDSVILIGGSSRIPLIERNLQEALSVVPRRWQKQDVAVALGAAFRANEIWGPKKSKKHAQPSASFEGTFITKYRQAVETAWKNKVITRDILDLLFVLSRQLRISKDQATEIERQVMGDYKEAIFDRQEREKKAVHLQQPAPPSEARRENPSSDKTNRGSTQTIAANAFVENEQRQQNGDYRTANREHHRGTAILTLGILSIVTGVLIPALGFILGIIAVSMGQNDLTAMRKGRMDQAGEGPTHAGWVCGLVGIGVSLFCFSGYVFLAAH